MLETEFEQSAIRPLEKIALTFSGGGYRAAAYALGVLSYFNRIQFNGKPLLQNVKAISTVSGGTITGASYAESASQGIPFQQFYKNMYDFLNEDKLMDNAMAKLEDNEYWKTNHKKRSLINAFAESYYELLVKENFKALEKPSHLEDIIFNATEFNNANVFRFQTTGNFGNYFTTCTELNAVKDKVLLSDAIAASSCFPLGFEPIVFPDDFFDHKLSEYEKLKRKPQFRDGLGLMDGGIVDNQGVDSILHADERRSKKTPKQQFDLLMICDVGGPLMEHWLPETDKEITGFGKKTISELITSYFGLGKWNWVLWFLLFLGILSAVIAEKFDLGNILIWISGIVTGFSLMLVILGLVMSTSLRISRMVSNLLIRLLPTFARSKLKYFDELSLGLLERMLKERITSTVSMVSEVFMKQVRRFTYYQVYENKSWKYRRTANLIYELTASGFQKKKNRKEEKKLFEFADTELENPGEKIHQAAAVAASTPTTLWFSEDDRKINRLNHLIACGQFTTCFNLLYYLGEIKNDPESPLRSHFDGGALDKLYKDLLKDWADFKNDPLFLL